MGAAEVLLATAGSFRGEGVNHASETFTGEMEISPTAGNEGAALRFTATGRDGAVYHDERALLGPGMDGRLRLVAVSTNTRVLVEYVLSRPEEERLVFEYAPAVGTAGWRERRELVVHEGGDVAYRFWWAMGDAPLQEQSSVRMHRIS